MSGFYFNGENFDRIFFTEHQLIDRFVGNRAFATGFNVAGALGDATTVSKSVFVDPSGVGSNWKQIITSGSSAAATSAGVKTDGTLWTWGNASYGVLGSGTTTSRSSPNTTSGGGTDWMEVAAGRGFMAAIKLDGSLWTWGYNGLGELGTGTTTNRSSPGTTAAGGGNWLHVAASQNGSALGSHCVAVKNDGTLWTWGYNSNGQLGNGTTTNRSSPGTVVGGGNDWAKVAAGGQISAAIKNDGTLWTWGRNSFAPAGVVSGGLGDGTTVDRSSPVTIAGGGTNWEQVSITHSLSYGGGAVKIDGTLWTWGNNAKGQLGDGTTTTRSSPVTVAGGGTNWKQVSCGYAHAAAVKYTGELYTWGRNEFGQLGDGTTTSRSSPGLIIGSAYEWQQVSCSGGWDENIVTPTVSGITVGIAYFV